MRYVLLYRLLLNIDISTRFRDQLIKISVWCFCRFLGTGPIDRLQDEIDRIERVAG